jgi:hypothetical protein
MALFEIDSFITSLKIPAVKTIRNEIINKTTIVEYPDLFLCIINIMVKMVFD